jgi:O-antigen ligase
MKQMSGTRVEAITLAVIAAAMGPIAVYGANWVPALGVIGALASCLAIAGFGRRAAAGTPVDSVADSRRSSVFGPLPWLLAATMVWSLVTAMWAPDPSSAVETTAKLTLVCGAALLLLRSAGNITVRGRRAIAAGLIAGFGLSIVSIVFEFQTQGAGLRLLDQRGADYEFLASAYGRAGSIMALLIWPASIAIYRKVGFLAAIIVFALGTYVSVQLDNTSSLLALLIGAGVFFAATIKPNLTGRAMAVLVLIIPIVTFASPAIAPIAMAEYIDLGGRNVSALHRLGIWDFVGERAQERPVFGWGMDASPHMGDGAEIVEIVELPGGRKVRGPLISLHPHNAILQIWLELGLPGVAAFMLVLLLLLRWIGRSVVHRVDRAASLAMFASGLVVIELSYGIWQGWWQASLWISAALMLAMVGSGKDIGQENGKKSEASYHG